jgi:hypothetical protein
MKKQKIILLLAMIIVAIATFTGCGKKNYEAGDFIPPEGIKNAEWKWHDQLSDSTKTSIINFFEFMTAGQNLNDSLLHNAREKGLLDAPDSLNSDIEAMYKGYFTINPTKMQVITRTSHAYQWPTLLEPKKSTFHLTIFDPTAFRMAEVEFTEKDDGLALKIFMALSFLLCVFLVAYLQQHKTLKYPVFIITAILFLASAGSSECLWSAVLLVVGIAIYWLTTLCLTLKSVGWCKKKNK